MNKEEFNDILKDILEIEIKIENYDISKKCYNLDKKLYGKKIENLVSKILNDNAIIQSFQSVLNIWKNKIDKRYDEKNIYKLEDALKNKKIPEIYVWHESKPNRYYIKIFDFFKVRFDEFFDDKLLLKNQTNLINAYNDDQIKILKEKEKSKKEYLESKKEYVEYSRKLLKENAPLKEKLRLDINPKITIVDTQEINL